MFSSRFNLDVTQGHCSTWTRLWTTFHSDGEVAIGQDHCPWMSTSVTLEFKVLGGVDLTNIDKGDVSTRV